MRKHLRALIAVLVALAPVWPACAQTQIETLKGSITPGNDENYCILLFDAGGVFTTAYLPVEQEYSASSFSVPVAVPVTGMFTETATVLGVYGGNGGVNDTPVSVVMNVTDAATATALSTSNQAAALTLAEDEMVGPDTFASTFNGADEATIFNDMETGAPSNITDLENFMTANASEFDTLSNDSANGDVVAFSQPDPGYASFTLVVPEPNSFWMMLGGAGFLAGCVRLRRRRCF